MKHRKPFNFRSKQVIQHFLFCMPCRGNKSMFKHSEYRIHMLYKRGIKKLKEDLDARHILKTVHRMRIIQQIMFSRRQKLLIKFAKKTVLDSASSGTDSDKNAMDAIAVIDHKNHLIQQPMQLRVERSLTQLVKVGRACPEVNKRILKAIFTKQIKDYYSDIETKHNIGAFRSKLPNSKNYVYDIQVEELQKSRDLSVKEEPPKSILKLNQNVETLTAKNKDLKRHSLQIAMSSKRDSRRELLEENKT